jgi:hypothetical protein
MTRKNVFVKVSGDVVANTAFLEWVATLTTDAHVCICVGGGTRITAELAKHGYTGTPVFGALGRELATFAERQIARNVLEWQQKELQDALAAARIGAVVEIPALYFGTVLCHVNGDTMVETVYLGYDELFVVTLSERLDKKKAQFAHFPKVRFVGF